MDFKFDLTHMLIEFDQFSMDFNQFLINFVYFRLKSFKNLIKNLIKGSKMPTKITKSIENVQNPS